ncbi:MAG TPA: S9 family peptidase [Chloroflexia bacterium]|nr:S9 family peptidase [Chloroflexia bacterium]
MNETPSKRNVEIEDLYRFRLVSDPQASPDGTRVAYVQTRLRKKKNDYASNIWVVPTDGSAQPIKFTGSDARDMSPRWSPDGQELAFISTRSGKPQVWVISLSGGEARRLTRVPRGVGEFEWSPNGRWIAYTSQLDSERDKELKAKAKDVSDDDDEDKSPGSDVDSRQPGDTSEEGLGATFLPAGEWEEDEDEKSLKEQSDQIRVIERLHYKADGEGFLEREAHLFLIPSNGGKARQLTSGDTWSARMPRWSPDGTLLAFVTNMEPDADYHNIQDIFVIQISDDGSSTEPARITDHNCAIRGIDWLPSGDGFALFAHKRTDEAAYGTNAEVWTMSMDGLINNLTESMDRNAAAEVNSDLRSGVGTLRPRFSKDGTTIFFMAMDGGSVPIFSVPVAGGEVKKVIGGERMALNFAVTADSIIFGSTTATHPNDIYIAGLDGSNERALTDVNGDILGSLEIAEPQSFWIDREDGARVQGWLLFPPDYDKSKKYPMVVEIHGGPHTAYGDAYFHEFQLLAARGNIVLYTNPRGSQGYGQAFSDAIINDWGGVDYDDIMACVDYAISHESVDESKMGVGGGSYGGYMAAWIVGHTDRFKAAVASRLVSNLYSAWGSGDFTWMLWNWEFQGTPQERAALYLERSPVTYADNVNTPLLLTHAEDDYRCNIEQAQQMYMALKVRKKEVKLVLLPSGGHDVSRSGKPTLRVERLKHIVEWFGKYLSE